MGLIHPISMLCTCVCGYVGKTSGYDVDDVSCWG